MSNEKPVKAYLLHSQSPIERPDVNILIHFRLLHQTLLLTSHLLDVNLVRPQKILDAKLQFLKSKNSILLSQVNKDWNLKPQKRCYHALKVNTEALKYEDSRLEIMKHD